MTFIILAGIGALVAGVFARNEYKIRKHVKKENLITLSEVVKQEYNLPNDFKFSHNSQDFDNNLNGYYKKLHAQTAAFVLLVSRRGMVVRFFITYCLLIKIFTMLCLM